MLESIENKLPDIAVAMQKAYTEVLPTKTSKDLETHNSEPFLKWDCINTSLKGLDGYKTFEVRKTRRGSWSFLMLFESNSQTIFTLIKKKHFESIQKSRSKAIPKYIQQMLDCLQNKDLIGDGAPYFLWENESEDRDMVNAMAMECFSFKCIKELSKAQHTFIVFDDFNDHLSFLSAIVVDNNFFQVGEPINMMNMFTPELPLPLDTVPTSESEKPKVALSALALKIREERKLGN